MKQKFGDIFWNLTTLNSYVYQEDQQNLTLSTYCLPEILIRLVNVQQDVFHAGKQSTFRVSYDREVCQHFITQPPFMTSTTRYF